MRHLLIRAGVVSFWAALTIERRALEVWREQRAQRALAQRRRRAERLKVWAEHMKDRLSWRGRGHCLSVPAWSLPDSPKMRGLGLGRMWTVLCPYCDEFHTHSPGEGRRTPHCCNERDRQHYILKFAGALPVEYRTRFYRSSRSGLPRLLHRWPDGPPGQRPGPEVAGLLAA